MDWTIQDLGAIGEFVGSIGVVMSLLYLSVQIRNQIKEARAAAMHQIWVAFRDAISTLGSPHIAEVYTKALIDVELSDPEQLQLIVSLQRVLRVWGEAFIQNSEGRLDDNLWDSISTQFGSVMSNRAFRMVWELRSEVYSKHFREFVDGFPVTEYRIRAA